VIAELTLPDLVSIHLLELTRLVEDGLTARADLGVTSCHLALVCEAVEGDLEDVSVELLPVDLLLLNDGCTRTFRRHIIATEASLLGSIFAVTEVEATTEIVGVHILAREVAVNV